MKVKFGKEKQELIFKLSSFLPLEVELENCTITVTLNESQDKSETVEDNSETDLEECKEFWENGQLRSHCYYIDGWYEGEFTAWHDNGQMSVHGHYKNGNIEGEYKIWDKKGKLWENGLWENGKYVKSLL